MVGGDDPMHSNWKTAGPAYKSLHVPEQVSDESGMQVVHDHDEAKQVAYSDGMEAVPKHEFFAPETVGHHEQVPRSARTKWVIGGVVGLVVIIAVVLGGVLGSRRHDSTAPGSSSTSSTTNSHPSSTPYAYQRNIAAVSTTLNSQNTTRVYYQDDTGQLFEAVEDGSTWQNNALGFSAKNGSPIAAAISRPGFPLTIDVYYVDSDNLIHDITWNAPTGPWKAGNVSSQNYTTGPNCSIAVTLDQCALCANSTLLTFQDRDNDVQVSNRTAGAWNLTPLNLGALTNTGLALVSNHEGTTIGPINLYFQKQSSKDLAQASWVPGLFDNSETFLYIRNSTP
ncbi:MAG: hypothetical protein M1827_007224 [Pycnora praestabilis]|nr:MAG: hypothetical protein M1827_007224 [Pycnora praestabilis]